MNSSWNFLAPAVKFMICKAPKHHQRCLSTKFTKILSDSDKCWQWGCGWVKNWFKYMECQTFGNILRNWFALQVKYISVMIQRRSGTNFNGIFVNLKLTTEGQKAINIMCTSTQTVKFQRETEIKLSIISKQGWTWSTPAQLSKGMKSAWIFKKLPNENFVS